MAVSVNKWAGERGRLNPLFLAGGGRVAIGRGGDAPSLQPIVYKK